MSYSNCQQYKGNIFLCQLGKTIFFNKKDYSR